MDSSQQNWLGFSLSNNHQDASQVSQAPGRFETLSSPLNNTPNNIVDAVAAAEDSSAAVFSGGPKLEDFLGGGGGQFSGNAAPVADASANYESELKRIAASFLRGFSAEKVASSNTSKQVTAGKKAVDTFGQRTSMYRGVTRHRWTGRYEAHLWDNSCRREGQSRKGRQVYLGGYDKEEKAARAYDLAALKYWGPSTTTNFPISNYENEAKEMKNMTRQEFVASLRRRSSGFSRGASKYRGVTRHHQHGRWQARIGRVAGNKDLYLGTFSTQEEAAEAYDIAAIKFRGLNAVTNFDMTRYDVRSIASSNLPVGGGKSRTPSDTMSENGPGNVADDRDFSPAVSSLSFSSPSTSTLSFALPVKHDTPADYWTLLSAYPNQNQYLSMNGAVSVLQTPKAAFGNDFSASYNNNSSVPESGTAALHGVAAGNGSSYVTQAQSHNSGGVTGGGVSVSSNVPFGTPIGLSTSGGCDQVSGHGSWGTVPFHSFQASKPSGVSVFQTPIFGVE